MKVVELFKIKTNKKSSTFYLCIVFLKYNVEHNFKAERRKSFIMVIFPIHLINLLIGPIPCVSAIID